jgi:hypothetical protein
MSSVLNFSLFVKQAVPAVLKLDELGSLMPATIASANSNRHILECV